MSAWKKIVVLSWDNDEEQMFWDTVMARSTNEARSKVARVRPYAVVSDALDLDDLKRVVENVETHTTDHVKLTWTEMVAQHKEEEGA